MGVRVIVVGIGPDARKAQYRQVLDDIGGNNVILIDDYEDLDEHTGDILKLVCRKYRKVTILNVIF